MSISKITLILITINVVLFAWQILTGVNISNPSIVDALSWGADYAPLTFLAEPYRLFSSMFFHFGLVHLMFNMWALYIFGNVAEQTLGRVYYLGLYVLAGLMGSLLSGYLDIRHSYEVLQNFDPSLLPRVSAGASGAVMGLGGALTALSFFPPTAQQRYILDRKALLMVLAINLAFGFFASGINNAAHVGGMLMGIILALAWYASERQQQGSLAKWVILTLGALLTYAVYVYCQHLIEPIIPFWQEALHQMNSQLHR